jgi:hypothetical protein
MTNISREKPIITASVVNRPVHESLQGDLAPLRISALLGLDAHSVPAVALVGVVQPVKSLAASDNMEYSTTMVVLPR